MLKEKEKLKKRRVKFAPYHVALIRKMIGKGYTDGSVARHIGISASLFWRWKKERPAVTKAYEEGKKAANELVENALFRRAVGYKVKEKKVETNSAGHTKVTMQEKQMSPSVGAGIFWLCNRLPDRWKQMKEIAVGGTGVPIPVNLDKEIDLSGFTDEELKAYQNLLDKVVKKEIPSGFDKKDLDGK